MNPRTETHIRRLHPEEAETCARIMAESDPWMTLRRGYEASLKLLNDPMWETYVAEAASEVAGFVVISMTGPFTGYIRVLCVAPGFRNQGIGTRLLAFAEQRIFRDSPNVFLCVSSFNPNARRLYRRLGYEEVGEMRDFVVQGHSEFFCRKTIGPIEDFKKS